MTQENDLLTRDEVLTLLKVSRSKLYELMRQDFPKPESTERRLWGQSLKKPEGAPLNLGEWF